MGKDEIILRSLRLLLKKSLNEDTYDYDFKDDARELIRSIDKIHKPKERDYGNW